MVLTSCSFLPTFSAALVLSSRCSRLTIDATQSASQFIKAPRFTAKRMCKASNFHCFALSSPILPRDCREDATNQRPISIDQNVLVCRLHRIWCSHLFISVSRYLATFLHAKTVVVVTSLGRRRFSIEEITSVLELGTVSCILRATV
jgi:hypothetical protein